MPLAAAIPALIGIGGSIAGGVMGSKAAGSAANIQSQAADQAGKLVQGSANTAAGNVESATATGQQGVQTATDQGIADATTGANSGITAVQNATTGANSAIQSTLDQQRQNQDPYMQAGKMSLADLQKYLTGDGAKQFGFTPDQFKNTPGFQFELEQGERALQRSAAARGGAVGGSAQKALMAHSQGLASLRYGQASDRAQDIFSMNRKNTIDPLMSLIKGGQDATNNMNLSEGAAGENTANNLMKSGIFSGNTMADLGKFTGESRMRGATTIANLGQHGASESGRFRVDGDRAAADYMLGGANARAAGKIGKTRAWTGAITGAANAAGEYFTMRNMGNKRARFEGD